MTVLVVVGVLIAGTVAFLTYKQRFDKPSMERVHWNPSYELVCVCVRMCVL